MPKQAINIAIDGYSSCGKSTLAKALAKQIHYEYIDSGAMYRCVTLAAQRAGTNLDNHEAVTALLKNIQISFKGNSVLLNDEDVSQEIRSMEVSNAVSKVSAIKQIRSQMVGLQQSIGKECNVVMDGRDIGTTVFPLAQLKIFMTADPDIRAQRRFSELQAKGINTTLQEVQQNLNMRDYEDTHRSESPLMKANDAFVLDNSDLTEEMQLAIVLQIMRERELIQ